MLQEDIQTVLFAIALLGGIGTVWALPIRIKAVRNWAIQSSGTRTIIILCLMLASFTTMYSLNLYVRTFWLAFEEVCYRSTGFDLVVACDDELAVQLGFENGEEFLHAVIWQLFKKQTILVASKSDCSGTEQAYCNFIRQIDLSEIRLSPEILFFSFIPSFVTAYLAWRWTRPYPIEVC